MAKSPKIYNVAISNVGMHGYAGEDWQIKVSAGFEYKGARFHLWLFLDQNDCGGPVLYKNGPEAGKRTRYMEVTSPPNVPLVAEMWKQIREGDLIRKALAARQDELDAEEAERVEKMRVHRIGLAGLPLYNALKRAAEFLENNGGDEISWIGEIRAALALAEGRDVTEVR